MEANLSVLQAYFSTIDTKHQALIEQYRPVILSASPQMEESIKYKTLFYTYQGLFCYFSVDAKSDRAYIGFCDGHLLKDPLQLLSQEGAKEIRRLYLDKIDAHGLKALQELLNEAIWLKDRMDSARKLAKKNRIL